MAGGGRRNGPSLRVNVVDLLRRPGVQRAFERTALLDDLALSHIRVVPGEPIELDLVLEAIPEGIVVTGRIGARWEGDCRRCAEPTSGRLDIDLREIFSPRPIEGETYPLAHDSLDLAPMVREAVLTELPLAPLCRPDCPGPDPERFPTEPAEGGEPSEPSPDPRWAALDQLRLDR
ncbi:MAG: YceD family protein [Acidimicrobiales bacterium]